MYYFNTQTGLPNFNLFKHQLMQTLKQQPNTKLLVISLAIQNYSRLQYQLAPQQLDKIITQLNQRLQAAESPSYNVAYEGEGLPTLNN